MPINNDLKTRRGEYELYRRIVLRKYQSNEKRFDRDTQYAKALERFCKNENKLTESLEGDNLKLFNDLVNASDEVIACTGTENFKMGFILGVQLMADRFKYDAKTIFKDI